MFRHIRMLLPQNFLPYLQSPLAQRLSFFIFTSLPVQYRQIIQGRRYGRMILAEGLLADGQSVVEKISGLFIFILVPIKLT